MGEWLKDLKEFKGSFEMGSKSAGGSQKIPRNGHMDPISGLSLGSLDLRRRMTEGSLETSQKIPFQDWDPKKLSGSL